jgi:hypothetical protein
MRVCKKYDINRLRDYSSLFSRSEVSKWYKNDWSSLKLKIDRYDSAIIEEQRSYLFYLKKVYRILEIFYPNEYVYKNEFITKWLMNEIGLENSIIFSEFRLGKAVADLAMFNGVSKVFEIKTLLDKETRLNNQLEQYSKLFNEVYLVVPDVKSHLYMKRDSATGVIAYNNVNNSFSLLRQAVCCKKDINVDVLMEVLHTHEYVKAVEQYFGYIPKFDDFTKFQVCKELIGKIPSDILSEMFVTLMKARRIHNEFSKKESQFNQLFLAMNYNTIQKQQLLSNLNTIIC